MTPSRLIALLLALAVLAAGCGGSDESSTDEADGTDASTVEVTTYETDLAGLEALYPLGDLDVDTVRWRHHNDFVNEVEGSRDLPAQDGDKIVEAVFTFADASVRDSLLDGRTTTLDAVPDWYPTELADAVPVTVAVSRSVDGLPGVVSVFPDVPGFVVVSYDPNAG